MAAPNGDQDTSLRDDTPKMALTTLDSETSQIKRATSLITFHYYVYLPFELRAQIRTEAIKAVYPNANPSKYPDGEKPCSRLATVSKEWQHDVERALFREVRIDPCNQVDVTKLKELFTPKRKRFLMRLDIAIDDDKGTSPWHQRMGLLRISQVMGQIGQFFHYINGWDLCREGEKQQSLKVVFTTSHQTPGCHAPMDEQPQISIGSLWEKKDLDRLTNRGLITTDIALWAIKSEFPSSLNMVTHLTFLPDCVPLSAAQKIISTMPNLETCVLEVSFNSNSEDGWRNFTSRNPLALHINKVYETHTFSNHRLHWPITQLGAFSPRADFA